MSQETPQNELKNKLQDNMKDLSNKEAQDLISQIEETLTKGKVKKFFTKLTKYQSFKVVLTTYSTVTALDWLKDPNFWRLVDFIYQGIKYWLLRV